MAGLDTAGIVAILGTIATLVFLEGLLSADNALVLAVMVRHLPKDQQKRALRYGIFGAFFFRFVAILFAATLLEYWWFKVVGGLYLLYLAVTHLAFGEGGHGDDEKKVKVGKGFWGTVIGVELADIAFSIDSILAAVAMADGLPKSVGEIIFFSVPGAEVPITMKLAVIYIGGILGILAMRFVAGYFLILLDKFSGLAIGAYYLVAWIGLKLVGGGLHNALHPKEGKRIPDWHASAPSWLFNLPFEMNEVVFWVGMGMILTLSLLLGRNTPPTGAPTPEAMIDQGSLSDDIEAALRVEAQELLGEEATDAQGPSA